ncbi:MAG: MBL fold metallo-hydrolase [Candidatus Korobacteraceae bacterium]
MKLRFWGVRGSVPVPEEGYLGYGGNTPCLEVRVGETILIIDAGTGIRKLGIQLQDEFAGGNMELNLLLSHFHWDHIQGLPFFPPLFSAANRIIFYSCQPEEGLKKVLEDEMSHPHFPVDFDLLAAKRDFVNISKSPLRRDGLRVETFPLNHPQDAAGYRIEAHGIVITHASDFEHGDPELDKTLREYAKDADVLIYDAQYTPAEYEAKKGWGHSTWLEATRVARDCNVKRLILFHHDPEHDDNQMRQIVSEARRHFQNTDAATEGLDIIF